MRFAVEASTQPTLDYAGPCFQLVEGGTGRIMASVPLCEVCDEPLTESQIRRGARHCGGSCRAKAFEARNPRLPAASVEQLEGELLKRLGKAAGRAEGKEVTVRALTRNVRVLKRTWMKVRSMTPSRETFMQTLEKIVHEAWLGKEEEA